jgi:hypothetical protein
MDQTSYSERIRKGKVMASNDRPYDNMARDLLHDLGIGADEYHTYRASSFLEIAFMQKDQELQRLHTELAELRQFKAQHSDPQS